MYLIIVAVTIVFAIFCIWNNKRADTHIGHKPKAPAPLPAPGIAPLSTTTTEVWWKVILFWIPRKIYSAFDFKKHGRLAVYPIIVLGLVDLVGWYLHTYHQTWWEPWEKDKLLFFWVVPFTLTVVAGIMTLKRTVPFLISLILLLLVAIPVGKAYDINIREWWQDHKLAQERAKEVAYVEAKKNGTLNQWTEVRIAENSKWSLPVEIPKGKHFNCDFQWEDGDTELAIRTNGTRMTKYGPSMGHLKLDANVRSLEFQTPKGHRPVKVIVTIW